MSLITMGWGHMTVITMGLGNSLRPTGQLLITTSQYGKVHVINDTPEIKEIDKDVNIEVTDVKSGEVSYD